MSGKTLYVELVASGLNTFVTGTARAAEGVLGVGRAANATTRDLERLALTSDRTRTALSNVALIGGAALVAGLAYGVKAAVDLERELANVATISTDVQRHFGDYEKQLVAMSTRLPQSAATLAKGLYDIVSSGFQAKDALLVLDAAASSASAGLTDTATASRAITAVLNAYGLAASDAADVSDILFQTVNKGVVTFDEAANSIGFFAGTAAAAKVPFEDVASAFAAITLSGFDASESATRLNQLLAHLLRPSQDLTGALHALGYESGAQALQVDGLHGVILKLAHAQGVAADTAFKLFPDIRAAGGYMALTAAQGRNYASTFDAIADKVQRAEASHKALAQQQKSTAYQMKLLENNAVALGITVGQALLPVLKAAATVGEDFLHMWQAMPEPLQIAVGLLGGISGAVLLAGGAFLRFKPAIDSARAGLALMRTEGSLLPTVLAGAGTAVGVLGVALVAATAVYGIYASEKARTKAITDSFVQSLQQEAQGVAGASDATIIKKLVDNGDIDRLKRVGVSVHDFVNAIKGDKAALDRVNATGVEYFGLTEDAPASMAANVQKHRPSLNALGNTLENLSYGYMQAKAASDDMAQSQAELDVATGKQTGAYADLHSSLDKAKDGTAQLNAAQKVLQQTLDGMVDPATAVTAVLKGMSGSALGDAITAGTGKAGLSLSNFEASLRKTAKTQRQWEADLTSIGQRGAPELADALRDMGSQGVKLARKLADGSQTQLDRVKADYASLAPSTRRSLAAFITELQRQLTDQQAYANNLAILARRGRYDLVAEFQKLGPSAAPLVAQAVHATGKELDKLEGVFGSRARLATDTFDVTLQTLAAIAADHGKATVQALADQFTHGDLDAMIARLHEMRTAITDIPTRSGIAREFGAAHDPDCLPGAPGSGRPGDRLAEGVQRLADDRTGTAGAEAEAVPADAGGARDRRNSRALVRVD